MDGYFRNSSLQSIPTIGHLSEFVNFAYTPIPKLHKFSKCDYFETAVKLVSW